MKTGSEFGGSYRSTIELHGGAQTNVMTSIQEPPPPGLQYRAVRRPATGNKSKTMNVSHPWGVRQQDAIAGTKSGFWVITRLEIQTL